MGPKVTLSASSDAPAGRCCPYDVLGIPRDASVELARAAAEDAVTKVLERAGKDWIMNMKLAAFAAIVTTKLGEDKAWELYQEVGPKRFAALNVFGSSRGDLPQRPALAADARPEDSKRKDKGATTLIAKVSLSEDEGMQATSPTESDGMDVNAANVPSEQKDTSQVPEAKYWWQVKKGPAGKRKWGWVNKHVNDRLEDAFEEGLPETDADIDGWTYHYDLVNMVQTSPGEAGTQREIRREIWEEDS